MTSNLPSRAHPGTFVVRVVGSKDKRRQRNLPAYTRYHFRYGPRKAYVSGSYSNDDDYFADVAKAYQVELKILHDAGVRNVQVDDPNLACKCSFLCRIRSC